MPLRHVLKNGRVKLDSKSVPTRVKRAIIASTRPTFGGVELEDLKFAAFPIGTAYLVVYGVLFSVMLFYQVKATVGQHFLKYPEPGENGKDPPGLQCEPIPRNQTQTIFATYDGYWSTEREYDEGKSIFQFKFQTGADELSDDGKLKQALAFFGKKLSSYGKRGKDRSMIWNLMILCSIGLHHQSSNTDLSLSTDATFIFNNVVTTLALSSAKGVCVGKAPLTTFTPGSPANQYLSGSFETCQASLQMTMPFTITRASVYGNKTDPTYQITTTPRVLETCPEHGSWVRNIFNPGDAQFRTGEGKVDFDVRGLLYAAALNLNLISTTSLVVRSSDSLAKIGFFSLTDTWYAFPPMQRIYCVNKSSPVWGDEFLPDEQTDQRDVMTNPEKSRDYKFPNVCFAVSGRKTKALQLFYPVLSQLKRERPPCVYTPQGCPSKLRKEMAKTTYPLRTCSCPRDANDTECNRLSIFTGLIYDVDIANSNFLGNTTLNRAMIIKNDKAVHLGIAMQRKLRAWREAAEAAGAQDSSDLQLMDLFGGIFEATMRAVGNVEAVNLPGAAGSISAKAQLAEAWGKLGDKNGGLAAIIMRSIGIEGASNFILPVSRFSVQLVDLVEDQAEQQPPQSQWHIPTGQYYEVAMNSTFKAVMCQNLFSRLITALDKLSRRSPLPLTETYLKCVRKNEVSVVIALGSAWSTTNLLCGLLWAVAGWGVVHALKHRHRMTGDRTAVVTRHTKQDLAEIFQDMKDEALLHVLSSLRDRGRGGSGGGASYDDEQWAHFHCLFHRQRGQGAAAYAEDEALGAELSRRANARARDKHEQLMEMLEGVGVQRAGGGAESPGMRSGSLRASVSDYQAGDRRFSMRSHPLASGVATSPSGFMASNPLAPRASVSGSGSGRASVRRFSFNANAHANAKGPRRDSVAGEGLEAEEQRL